jgi:hypothetical protein
LDNILKCRELEVLILSFNPQLLGTNFLLIPSNLIHLTELDVQGCVALDKKCVHDLQVMMPNLKITGSYTNNMEPDVNLGDAAFFSSD